MTEEPDGRSLRLLTLAELGRPILVRLAAEARAIQAFHFDAGGRVRSFVFEIDQLAVTMEVMRSRLRSFLDISAALAAERSVDRLEARVLAETIQASAADGGILYLLSDDERSLVPAVRQDGQAVDAAGLPSVPARGYLQRVCGPVLASRADRRGGHPAVCVGRQGRAGGQ